MIVAQIKFIACFLTILEGQKKEMLSRVDKHMAKVFQTGHDWMENKLDQRKSFPEITAYLNKALDLIGDTSQRFNLGDVTKESTTLGSISTTLPGHLLSQTVPTEIKPVGDKVGDVTQGSFPSGLDARPLPEYVKPQPVPTEIKPLDEFGDEIKEDSTSDLHVQSIPDHSFSQPEATEIKPMTDEDTMKKILASIDNFQKTFSSLQTAIDIVTNKQGAVEKLVKQRLDQMSSIEEQHTRRVANVEKQVGKLYREQKEEVNKLNNKLEKLETNITQLSASVSGFDQQISEYMKRIEDQVDLVRISVRDQEQYCESKIKETNKTVKRLTKKVDLVETSVSDLATSLMSDLNMSTNETALKLHNLDNGLKSEERSRQKDVESLEKKIMETENKLADEFDAMVSRNEQVEKIDLLESAVNRLETSKIAAVTRLSDMENKQNESKARMDRAAKAMFEMSSTYNGRRYYLSKRGIDTQVHTAEGLCEMFGGYLVEIDNSRELTFVQKFVKIYTGFKHVLIGGNDMADEGHFVFQRNKRPVSFKHWGFGQPDSYKGNEDCMCLYRSVSWDMNDFECYYESRDARFLCEVEFP